jgi:hypothetical protein
MSNLLTEATAAINGSLTLDNDASALSRLKRELMEILKRHEDRANAFQREVTGMLEAMKARREQALRSTTHGIDFQDAVIEFVQREAGRGADLASVVANTAGAVKYCKIGDLLVELGPDSAAAGERFIIEAKEDASYSLNKARSEIESARKNRDASVGLFDCSKRTLPAGQDPLLRFGNDVFVIWDSEDPNNDVTFKAALLLAKALLVRESRARKAELADYQSLDAAMLAIET